jgi:hypothetical protein
MKIDVPGYFAVGWPSVRGHPPGPSARGRPLAVGQLGCSSGRRPSDVIFPKDIRCDNPDNTLIDMVNNDTIESLLPLPPNEGEEYREEQDVESNGPAMGEALPNTEAHFDPF